MHIDQPIGVSNQAIIPACEALKPVLEFATSAALPKSIHWFEL
jgi:hypothetical protein